MSKFITFNNTGKGTIRVKKFNNLNVIKKPVPRGNFRFLDKICTSKFRAEVYSNS